MFRPKAAAKNPPTRTMKTKIQSILAALLLALASTNASAGIVTYIYDGGIEGTLGGNGLNDLFTLTLTMDSGNITYYPSFPSNPAWSAYLTPVVSASFTDPNIHSVVTITDPLKAYVIDFHNGGWTFGVISATDTLVSFNGTGSGYNLADPISLSNVGGSVYPGSSFNTSLGVLQIDRFGSGDSFTATAAGGGSSVSVPEPSAVAMSGLVGLTVLGYALNRRRK